MNEEKSLVKNKKKKTGRENCELKLKARAGAGGCEASSGLKVILGKERPPVGEGDGWSYSLRIAQVCSGEGNGTPLQYSCLENPMDRGVW